MAVKYPLFRLQCHDGPRQAGCGNHWDSSGAPGSTIRCPNCGKGQRMPADRPGTAAQARSAAGGGELGEAVSIRAWRIFILGLAAGALLWSALAAAVVWLTLR